MANLNRAIRFLTVASLGLFAGAMLTEGFVLVPYWRSLSPVEFFAWYAANDERLLSFFGALTTTAALLSIAAALVSFWDGYQGKWFALLATVLMLAVVSTFYLYFKTANASFTDASLPVDDVAGELSRWAKWHWFRTGLSCAALSSALASLWRGK